MPTLPNMGLITPTLGGDPGVWDDKINAMAGVIDGHDHTNGKGLRITPPAMNINADLSFGGNGATALGRAAFTPVAALASGATTLFVNTADGELYWRTAGGTNVKLTAGSSINTSLVGGIVGDYTAVSAQVAYDSANTRYTFKGASPNLYWAIMASGEVRAYPSGTNSNFYVGQKANAALAASYSVTWPLAIPGGQAQPCFVDSTGTMTFGVPTNTDIVVSGTGTLKHGVKTTIIPVLQILAHVQAGSANQQNAPAIPGTSLGNNSIVYYPLALAALPTHARIVNISLYFTAAADRNDCTVALYKVLLADPPTRAFVDTTLRLTPSGTAISKVTGANQPMSAGPYWLQVSNGVTTPVMMFIAVDWDIP